MKIFIDAMGGDQAPRVVVAGCALYAKEYPNSNAELFLLGDKTQVEPLVDKFFRGEQGPLPKLIHCSETIGMGESPVSSVRQKKDSSIVRGLELAAQNTNSAFFSAGHSGAVFAAALMVMGRIKGVERPAIAAALPTINGHCILLDAGANVDCRPEHLVDFAHMGKSYAEIFLKAKDPAIGLLSNGEEDSKGTDLTRAANSILKSDSSIHYLGYVEGKEIFNGKVHVVITDGFTGNVVLKSLEGLGKTITTIIKTELGRSLLTKLGALFSMPALHRVQKKVDYAEVGSAPLLGVDGNCFIGHGRSNSRAIKNGILRAQESIEMNLHPRLRSVFERQKLQHHDVQN